MTKLCFLLLTVAWPLSVNFAAGQIKPGERRPPESPAGARAIVSGTNFFRLLPNDCVAFVGGTTTVLDRKYSYLETLLTARFPGASIRFRNLGWEGDTVFEQSRRPGFGDLFHHLTNQQASAVFVNFGLMEALHDGKRLADFARAYGQFLDKLGQHSKQIVLLSPLRSEEVPGAVADTEALNRRLELYADRIKDISVQRRYAFVNLFLERGELWPDLTRRPLTYNGVHPSSYGYWVSSLIIEKALGFKPRDWRVEIERETIQAIGAQAKNFKRTDSAIRFVLQDELLPVCRFYLDHSMEPLLAEPRILKINDLRPGRYKLRVDHEEIAEATDREWAQGLQLRSGPEFEQVERLRELIVDKNNDFFNYWRPQNWEFLAGELTGQPSSRRHDRPEARWFPEEMKEFLALAIKKEAEISRLSVPMPRVYELSRIP